VVADLKEAGWGVVVTAPQEEGERSKEFGCLDSKCFESLERGVE
jgi:hypothetical protein